MANNQQPNTVRMQADTIRTLAEASITTSFLSVGSPLTAQVRIFCIINNTDGDMFFSIDGTNSHFFLPKNSFRLYDICTNRQNADPGLYVGIGTQFSVKYSTAPSTGAVYIECLWAQ